MIGEQQIFEEALASLNRGRAVRRRCVLYTGCALFAVLIAIRLFELSGDLLIAFMIASSGVKRPRWMGGNERRYTSDDTASAHLGRGARRSLGTWRIIAGAMFKIVGL
jgi:hypothetical protein